VDLPLDWTFPTLDWIFLTLGTLLDWLCVVVPYLNLVCLGNYVDPQLVKDYDEEKPDTCLCPI